MAFLSACFVALILHMIDASAATPRRTLRQCALPARTEYGAVCGAQRTFAPAARPPTSYVSYLGVPYSEQPLGRLRFADLPPPQPWQDYLDCSHAGPACPQYDVFYRELMTPGGSSEACLHANVHVPLDALPSAQREEFVWSGGAGGLRPVLVFVHGGGFAFGSGDPDLHGPEYLVERGVIVVTFNYRLNIFGFLSLNSSKVPGNAGLRDQVALLRWVRDNIRQFGGDPDDVTLGGQSAGAASAHLLSLVPAAEGLFRRVVMMSGSAIRSFLTTSPQYAEFISKTFLNILGIDSTDPDHVYEQLIATPLDQLLDANEVMMNQTGLFAFSPVVESAHEGVDIILPADPEQLMAEGRGKNLTMLLGFTENECQTFQSRIDAINMTNMFNQNPATRAPPTVLFSEHPENLKTIISSISARYFPTNATSDGLVKFCSDTYFVYPMMHLAAVRAEVGAAPTYLYQFAYEGMFRVFEEVNRSHFRGTAHAEDLTYVMRTNSFSKELTREWKPNSQDEKMRDWMTTLFTNFVKTGNPAGTTNYLFSQWRPVQKYFWEYQDIRCPHIHQMAPPTVDQNEFVHFFNNLYEESRQRNKRSR